MKNIYKYIITAVIVVGMMLFAGCGTLDIKAEITEDNLVTYSYTIIVTEIEDDEKNNKSIESLLIAINSHWNDIGFDSELTTDNETSTLTCTMQKQCDSRQQAFETLHEFMTNEITLFDSAEYSYIKDYYKEEYLIQSQINLKGIVSDQVYEVYPAVVGENIDEVLDSIVCKAVFSLPVNQSETSDVIKTETKTFDIPLDQAVNISIDGQIANNANAQYEKDLIAEQEDRQSKLIIYAIIGAVGLIAVVVQLIIFIKSGKKEKNKIQTENEDDNSGDDM